MTNNHPIAPSSELIRQWKEAPEFSALSPCVIVTTTTTKLQDIAIQAARWGSDQELEACCEWLNCELGTGWGHGTKLRAARRPKPPSLKEEALAELELLRGDANAYGLGFDAPAICNALESLPD